MNYKETTEFLFSQLPMFERQGKDGYKSGLENTLELDSIYGHPHKAFKTIHVAGTNGKGTVSHSLAALLQNNGYKVGLYTSPHLVDFRERIRINGECIPESYVVDFVEKGRERFEEMRPSFFELTTAMAFCYFRDQGVDFAVIEVGLGGRLDCTNIITPELCVITNISFDHTQFLGNTLSSIAKEKAGIIKRGVPVVIGETYTETRRVFEQVADEMDAPIVFAENKREVTDADDNINGEIDYFTTHYGKIKSRMAGSYQKKNANTILTAYSVLVNLGIASADRDIVADAMYNVAQMTGLRGRWQTVGTKPLVVCDTGHNVAAWLYLDPQIRAVKCKNRHIVFGMVGDKDIETVAEMLPKEAKYYFTQADSHRAIKSEDVKAIGERNNLNGDAYGTVAEAYKAALQNAGEDDFIFVGGSSYVVADFLSNCF
ncbi:MAG: bifunctional folylpolyglutamate synthase/dihydrofolate synthase [Prevotella sp.]|nr:bifunctional folylpolyglutamate synthase/dihydrofolate synthase [Prevotella sp.]